MSHDIHINFPHITRVEGHGNIVLNVKKGRIEDLRLEIVESPRFFEVMLKGRPILEATSITSRICGICAISHTTASIKACEGVLEITPPPEVVALRKVLMNAEILQSHILHVCFLVLPDFFGVGSVIPLAEKDPETVKCALRLKSAANEVSRILVGRHVHPVGMTVGGFKRWPSKKAFEEVKKVLEGTLKDMESIVNVFSTLKNPEFERETRYVSLTAEREYAIYDGTLLSSDGERHDTDDYKELITEEVVEYSTAKHAKKGDECLMVGALARLNNNFELISREAKESAEKLKLTVPSIMPYMNNSAQLVECVHTIHDSLRLIDELMNSKGKDLKTKSHKPKAGRGVGVVEAPRGTLYHEYETDKEGLITSVNCIIPTAQNLANIEKDIEAMVPLLLDKPKEEIGRSLEMLVRAYDPCISCSTHFLKVDFVE